MGFIEGIKRFFVKPKDLDCSLCNDSFSTSDEFDNHMKTVHK